VAGECAGLGERSMRALTKIDTGEFRKIAAGERLPSRAWVNRFGDQAKNQERAKLRQWIASRSRKGAN
jgi:hypothetical protein